MCVFYDAVFRFAAQMDLYTQCILNTSIQTQTHSRSHSASHSAWMWIFMDFCRFSFHFVQKERERGKRGEVRDKRGPE